MKQLSARSSEGALHRHEKGSLHKLCSEFEESIHLSFYDKGIYFCRDLHKEQSVYLYTPKYTRSVGIEVEVHSSFCSFLEAALCAIGYRYLSFTFVLHEAVILAPGSEVASP